jgi:hypothetical protein
MKPLARSFALATSLFGSALVLAACAADTGAEDKADVSAESESALTWVIRNLGEIPGSGEVRTTRYTNPPKYSAYSFNANGGEEVDVWVKGQGRQDAVAWILDANGRMLAYNDDAAEGGLGSHITTKLPARIGTKAKLRVVFREYTLSPATFSVSVRV